MFLRYQQVEQIGLSDWVDPGGEGKTWGHTWVFSQKSERMMVPLVMRDHEPGKRSRQVKKMRIRSERYRVLETHAGGNVYQADGLESEAQ